MKVEPFDSLGRFLVQSESRPEIHFIVDVLWDRCNCEDATIRRKRCKHLDAARDKLLEDMILILRKEQPDTETDT